MQSLMVPRGQLNIQNVFLHEKYFKTWCEWEMEAGKYGFKMCYIIEHDEKTWEHKIVKNKKYIYEKIKHIQE